MKHEGAWVQETKDGRVVVYMGDDERFEYIYRFVSNLPWKHRAPPQRNSPLDDGVLYVAQVQRRRNRRVAAAHARQSGARGWSLPHILINTRGAADAAGATKMDRPEWIDTFPESLTAIATLTNNDRRGTGTNPPTDAANPRVRERLRPHHSVGYAHDFSEPTFGWDIFALCGDPDDPTDGSTIVGDKYGSPDGIYVAPSGRLWIQTDVSGSTAEHGCLCRLREQSDALRRPDHA